MELQRRLREFVDRLPTENGLIKMDAKPGNAKAVAVLGLGMLRVGEPTFAGLAMEHLRQALTLSPALPNLQRAVGNELQKRARANPLDQGSFQQAFEAYTAALMRAPTDGTMYYDFGRLQTVREGKDNFGQPLAGFNISRHIGSNEDAVSKMWRTATTLSPADWRIARDLSLRLSQSRKKSLRTEAVTLAETAAQLAPHRTTVHVAVAAAHVRHALPTSLPTGRLSYANAEALGHNRKQRTAAVEALQRATSASLETRAQADAYYELGVLVHTIPPVKGREGQIALKDLKCACHTFNTSNARGRRLEVWLGMAVCLFLPRLCSRSRVCSVCAPPSRARRLSPVLRGGAQAQPLRCQRHARIEEDDERRLDTAGSSLEWQRPHSRPRRHSV